MSVRSSRIKFGGKFYEPQNNLSRGCGCDIYTCPSCGWEIDEMEYEYERDEDVDERGDDIPPAGCRACGGPYPNCKLSCKLFDD